jgi:hypothetical protein
MSYEGLNRGLLAVIALFAVLLYCGLVYAGFVEFMAGISKRGNRRKR